MSKGIPISRWYVGMRVWCSYESSEDDLGEDLEPGFGTLMSTVEPISYHEDRGHVVSVKLDRGSRTETFSVDWLTPLGDSDG